MSLILSYQGSLGSIVKLSVKASTMAHCCYFLSVLSSLQTDKRWEQQFSVIVKFYTWKESTMFNKLKQFWGKEEKEDKKNLVLHEVKPNRDNKDEKKNKK